MATVLSWSSDGQRPACGHRVAGAIAISQAVADDARKALPSLPIEVIYNAIDTEYFSPGPPVHPVTHRFDVASEAIRVGLVATYARWKGHDVF